MKNTIKRGLLLGILLVTLCISARAEDTGMQAKILFTHDIHSHLDAYVIDGESVGGLARLKTLVDEKRAEQDATILVDGGDFSMGTLYQTVYETQAVELSMLGYLGFDATTFGNHEFDYRSEGVANMFHAALQNAQNDPALSLPHFLIANIDWTKNTSDENQMVRTALEDYGCTPYLIIERGGVRFGIFAVMGEDAAACAPESGITFDDIIQSSQKMVETLQAENVDMIVCLSHSGTNADIDRSEDEQLAMAVPEIDVIISGHTHTRLEEPIRHGDTYIVSCGEYGQFFGEADFIQRADGRWELSEYTLCTLDDTIAEHQEIAARLEKYREQINEDYLKDFGYTADQVLAVNSVAFPQFSAFGEPSEQLGNLIADAYRYAVREAEGEEYIPVTASVAPLGTIRDTLQTGEITVWDTFTVCSLGIGKDRITGYPLVSIYLTGKEIRTAAEIDISVSNLMNAARLYPSGVTWSYNPHRMILNRVTEVKRVEDDGSLTDLEDNTLYRAVVGLYAAQMLGAVEDVSYGILSITPKDENGVPIENYEDHIIYDREGNEVKEWYALASYLESFAKNEDGISVVPQSYAAPDTRKLCEDSRNPIDLLKHPNSIALVVDGLVLLLAAGLVTGTVVLVRRRKRNH